MSEFAIRVAVRTRPLDKDEVGLPFGTMTFEGSSLCVQNKNYTFDYVFAPGVKNKDVYDEAVAEKICHLFEGCNLTILAYGSTGSGKTYTMGTNYDASEADSDVGIIPRCIQEMFRVMESRQHSMDFTVKVSFLELYREEIFDLLQKPPVQCALREDLDGFKVTNLTEVPVKSVDDAFMTLKKGCIARRTCATAKNSNSSRSHGMFCVHIEQTDKVTLSFKRSKFQLVDLAGSERMGSSKTTGLQVKEGININLGLLTLRNVISKLAEDKKQHIPFRNSKLTRLLQDSLGGNSHTMMIACINPSNLNIEETLSTLRYASCARTIKNQPQVNVDPPAVQIEKLKKQLQELQSAQGRGERIYSVQDIGINTTGFPASLYPGELFPELQKAYQRIRDLCQQSIKIRVKNDKLIDGFNSINEKMKLLIAELTADENLHQFLKNLEEIHQDFVRLMVSQSSEQYTALSAEASEKCEVLNLEEDKSNLEDPDQENLTLEEINEQDVSNKKLFEISECITFKTGLVKNLEDYFQTVETVDQDYVSSLVEKINKLVTEKETLEESMKNAAERMEKQNQDKITKYEFEIKELQKELQGKKIILKTKEENQHKIKCLQKEIEGLKRLKVDLAKQIKEGGTKFVRLQREKAKEVAKLVKDSRKKEFEFVKLKSKLESQLSVLKKRLDLVSQKKSVSKQIEARKKMSSHIRFEPIEKRIDQVLELIVEKKIAEVHNSHAEEWKSLIPNLEIYKTDAGRILSDEEEKCIKEKIDLAKSFVQTIIDKTAEDVKETQCYNESEVILNLVNSVSTFSEAKAGIQHLIKQHLNSIGKCTTENIVKFIELIKEHHEETNSLSDQNKQLCEETMQLQSELKSVKEEYEAKVIQQRQEIDTLRKELFETVQNLVNKQQNINEENIEFASDSKLQEKIKLQGEMTEFLNTLCEDHKKKSREIQQLSQQLFNAKKGKRVTWLGDLTTPPLANNMTTSMDIESDKSHSLLEEYLNDSFDESFSNDPNDPDWRGTPLYKRKQKASRKISPVIIDDEAPPAKKSLRGCNCAGGCKTMRCKCKKRNLECSVACVCVKEHCMNIPISIPIPSNQ